MMGLPRSAVKILKHLDQKGPMCPVDICETANIAPRTVSHALRRLTATKICRKIPNLQDMRRPLYSPNYERVKEIVERHGPESVIGSQLMMCFRR